MPIQPSRVTKKGGTIFSNKGAQDTGMASLTIITCLLETINVLHVPTSHMTFKLIACMHCNQLLTHSPTPADHLVSKLARGTDLSKVSHWTKNPSARHGSLRPLLFRFI